MQKASLTLLLASRLRSGALWPLALLVLVGGCDLDEVRTFVIPAESEVTVPGRAGISNPLAPADVLPLDFGALLTQKVAQQISTEGVPKEAVDSMKVTRFAMVVKDPIQGGQKVRHIGFFERVAFSLGAGNVAPRLVASSPEGAFDDDPVELELELTEVELVEVLNAADEMELSADVEIDPLGPAFETTVRFLADVTVLVDPIGAATAAGGEG